jgi:hypothetical protein
MKHAFGVCAVLAILRARISCCEIACTQHRHTAGLTRLSFHATVETSRFIYLVLHRATMRFFTIVALLFLVGCTQHYTIAGNQTIAAEVARLGSMTAAETAQENDFDGLLIMVEGDHQAEHDVTHAVKMVQYGEYTHASHALGFLGAYIESGKEVLCPGHDIAHYYVFHKHGDDHEMEHSLEAAGESIGAWTPLAQAYSEQYPGAESFAAVNGRIQDHLARIRQGNREATDAEIELLATGSLCVEKP